MQEAMDMTPEEFDAAAHQLLATEGHEQLRLPIGQLAGQLAPDPSWGDEEDERTPLNPAASGAAMPGAPERFTARDRQPSDANPLPPSRRRRGGGQGGGRGPDEVK